MWEFCGQFIPSHRHAVGRKAGAQERGGNTTTEWWPMGDIPYGIDVLGDFVSIKHPNDIITR